MAVPKLTDVVAYFDRHMPKVLAESWDNTGLLLGHSDSDVRSILCCLTITPTVVDEAIRRGASLVVSHHPLPFRPVATITDSTYYGGMIWALASAGIGVYSPHTRFDSALYGINQQLAELLELSSIKPLESVDAEIDPTGQLGRGRFGKCPTGTKLGQIVSQLKTGLKIDSLKFIAAGEALGPDSLVDLVAVGCGSAGEFVRDAAKLKCDLFVTGESTFHGCLEAQSLGVSMLLTSHYASERFAVESLAERLSMEFDKVEVWASHAEKSPVKFV